MTGGDFELTGGFWVETIVAVPCEGDLDGDQAPNLAVANYGGGNVSVLINLSVLLGDPNCDGVLNAFDIDPFVVCLTTGICECP